MCYALEGHVWWMTAYIAIMVGIAAWLGQLHGWSRHVYISINYA